MKEENQGMAFLLNSKNCLDIFKIKTKPIEFFNGDTDNLSSLSLSLSTKPSLKSNFPNSTISNQTLHSLKKFQTISINENNNNIKLIKEINESNNEEEIISTTQRENKSKSLFIKRRSLSMTEFLFIDYTKGTKSEEMLPNSPFIYSFSNFHPFSYLRGHMKGFYDKKGKLHHPSPTLISSEIWMKPPDLSKKSVLKGMEISNENGLVLVDKEVTKRFKGIIKELVKQLIKSAFSSQKFSLSVRLFEPKSFLQSISEYWFFLPKYIPQLANKNVSPIDRMKNIMAFAVSGLYIPSKTLKAFNPLISETFQGEIPYNDTKIKIYLEQISNYPNVSRFYITHDTFSMYGYFDISMKHESFGNKITLFLKGHVCLDFKAIKEKVYYIMPNVRVLNGASDNRSTYFTSSMVFADIKNNIKGVIQFATNKKNINSFEGVILNYKYPPKYRFIYDIESEYGKKLKITNKQNIILSKVNGSWLKNFVCDKEVLWNIDRDVPNFITPVKNSLPSDGRFREDIIWLYRSFHFYKTEEERDTYEKLAQEWKLMLEKLQREEREIKKKANKKK